MKLIKNIEELRETLGPVIHSDRTVGLVPTMGALHAGHTSLIKAAVDSCDVVVVSIFVNPTQFGPDEDFENYPRTLDEDLEICRLHGVDVVFAPSAEQMYPEKNLTWVSVEGVSELLCGANREGHFRGVTTVCSKLFNIVRPDLAFFGQKDAQQAAVIRKMVKDLNMPLEIIVCPTVRQQDGLAVSSRNKYLDTQQRKDAVLLYKSLKKARELIESGIKDIDRIKGSMNDILKQSDRITVEYIELVDPDSIQRLDKLEGKILVAIAVRVGKARLIDNILVEL